MNDERRAQTHHLRDVRRPSGHRRENSTRLDEALVRVHTDNPTVLDLDTSDRGLLMDLDTETVGASGVTPSHRVMAGDGAGRVKKCTVDRCLAAAIQVDLRHRLLDELGPDNLALDTQVLVGFCPPPLGSQGSGRVRQREVATLRVEEVEVQVARQIAKQLQTGIVKLCPFGCQIVRTNDGSIATRTTAADVALLENRNVRDAVVSGKVVGGRQTVTAAADNNGVIFALENRRRSEHPLLGIVLAEPKFE